MRFIRLTVSALWLLSGVWLVKRVLEWLRCWLFRRRWGHVHLYLAVVISAAVTLGLVSNAHAPDCPPAPVELLGAVFPSSLNDLERP